jgi:hypothetical protein
VGTDCPYYKSGYEEATLEFDDEGKVTKIVGPWEEKYKKTSGKVEKLNKDDNTFEPNYLGGVLKFDVNVSDVGCNCAAGVFLVALDDEKCKMGEYENSSPP